MQLGSCSLENECLVPTHSGVPGTLVGSGTLRIEPTLLPGQSSQNSYQIKDTGCTLFC